MRIGAHAPRALGRELFQLGDEPAGFVEQLLRLVALHPVFELLEVLGIIAHTRQRHLVGAPEAFDLVAINFLRARPALRAAQDDHRPARSIELSGSPRLALDAADFQNALFHRLGHLLMHAHRVGAFDEVRGPAIAFEKIFELFVRDAREDRRVVDLVAVEMQDRQHRAVADRVEELVRMPRRRQRPGFGFAVADDDRDDQIGIVECGAEGVRDRIAKLAAFVNRAGSFRRAVASDSARKAELFEELPHAGFVFALVGIDLGIRPFEIYRPKHARRAVAGAGEEDRVQIIFVDQSIQVDIAERQSRARAPMAEQTALDVIGLERLSQERILLQIDHAHGQVIAGAPVSVNLLQLFFGQLAVC